MGQVILCNLSDANQLIDEARIDWTYGVLYSLGVPEDMLDPSDIQEFRYNMEGFGVEVELISNGDVNIYKKQWHDGRTEDDSDWLPPTPDHLVAQWKEPKRIMKKEGRDVYYEIHLNEWSILNME